MRRFGLNMIYFGLFACVLPFLGLKLKFLPDGNITQIVGAVVLVLGGIVFAVSPKEET